MAPHTTSAASQADRELACSRTGLGQLQSDTPSLWYWSIPLLQSHGVLLLCISFLSSFLSIHQWIKDIKVGRVQEAHSPRRRGEALKSQRGGMCCAPTCPGEHKHSRQELGYGQGGPPGQVGVLAPTFSLFLMFLSGLELLLAPRLNTGMMGGSQCGHRLPASESPTPPFHPAGH